MTGTTHTLIVQIVRYVDDSFPGWVESEFVDANGHRHIVVDKVPIFTTEMLDATSSYPKPGDLPCEVLQDWRNGQGQELARIETPGIESAEGLSSFIVLRNQLHEIL